VVDRTNAKIDDRSRSYVVVRLKCVVLKRLERRKSRVVGICLLWRKENLEIFWESFCFAKYERLVSRMIT